MRNIQEYVEVHKSLNIKVWLKDTPTRRLSAMLKFQNKRTILEIEGEILKDDKQVLIEQLYGSDSNAQYFVFLNCNMMMVTYGHRKRTILDIEKVVFYPDKPITWEQAKANYIESTFKYLDYWLGEKLFDVKLKERKVSYKPRWKRNIVIDSDLDITFYSNLDNLYNYNINTRHHLDIKQKGYFSLKYKSPKELDDILKFYSKVENLLKLAYFSLWSEEYLSLSNDSEKFKVATTKYLPVYKELYFPRSQTNNIKVLPLIDWMFLFKFTDIPNKSKFFRDWLKNEEELSPIYLPVINLLSATLPEEYKFLGLINALELAYRRRYEPSDKKKHDYKKARNDLLSQIKATKKSDKLILESIKSMTGFSYQPSLKALLTDLVKKSRRIVYVEIDDNDIKDIADIRRTFIHNNFGSVSDPTKIYLLNRKLQKLLLVVLLLDLGFPHKKIKALITNYSQYNNLNVR